MPRVTESNGDGNPGPAGEAGPAPLSPAKRWAFRLTAALGVPLVFLLSVEGCLALVGFGRPTAFFVPHPADEAVVSNEDFGLRFFPPKLVQVPLPLRLPDPKPEGTFRVFVLGGSAAQGEPDAAFSFSRILEVMLRERFPGRRFEVVNAAVTAVNSHVMLPVGRELLRREPDLLVVYMGNNEVVGPFGAGTVLRAYSPSLGAVRAGIRVRSTKTGQLLEAVVDALGLRGGPETWEGMAMFQDHRVRFDDPRLERVMSHFRANVDDLLDAAVRREVPVILCTVAVNLKDCPPFASEHRPGLAPPERDRWTALYEEGIAHSAGGRPAEAEEAFVRALALDDEHAELQYRLGRLALSRGAVVEARGRFLRARDLDALRFRADSRINRVLREAAAGREGEGVRLADVERALGDAEEDGSGIPGAASFHEHVHLTFEGNYRVARALFPKVVAILALRGEVEGAADGPPASLDRCAEALLWTEPFQCRVVQRMVDLHDRAPFTGQMDHEKTMERLHRAERELWDRAMKRDAVLDVAQRFGRAVERAPEDLVLRELYALLLEEARMWGQASEQLKELLRRVPGRRRWITEGSRCLLELGNGRFAKGDAAGAEEALREAVALHPRYSKAHYNLGFVLASRGATEEALASYGEALALEPGFAMAWAAQAKALEMQGDLEGAERSCWRAIALDPMLAQGYRNLGDVLAKRGDAGGAAAQYMEAARRKRAWWPELRRTLTALTGRAPPLDLDEALARD